MNIGIRNILTKQQQKESKTEKDLSLESMAGKAFDTLAALTQGEFGGGHKKTYWQESNHPEMEFFVHALETYFVGNDVLKKYMPEVHKIQMNYIKSLVKQKK